MREEFEGTIPDEEVIDPITDEEWGAATPLPPRPPDDLPPAAESLPDKWWQNKATLEQEYEKYGTLSAVGEVHGVTATTLSTWWARHDLPALKRGPRGGESNTLVSGVHATSRKRAQVYLADGDWELLETIKERLHVKEGEAIRTAVRVYAAILAQSERR